MAENNSTAFKRCKSCDQDLPWTSFYLKNGKPAARLCRACKLGEMRKLYASDPEQFKKRAQSWKLSNPDRVLELRRLHTKRNKADYLAWSRAYREGRRDRVRASSLSWYYRNAHKAREANRRRVAVELTATPTWANKQKILAVYREARRIELATGVRYSVDHIVPLKHPLVCGLHNEFNLRAIPLIENLIKGNRHWPDMP
jgi:hypothetical protein